MEFVFAFLVAVLADVVCNYIIKWLDGDCEDDDQPSGCFATIKEKKKASTVLQHGRGFRSFVRMDMCLLFAYWHYSICQFELQYTYGKNTEEDHLAIADADGEEYNIYAS